MIEVLRHGEKILKCPECKSAELDSLHSSHECKLCGCLFTVLPNGEVAIVLDSFTKIKCPDCDSFEIETRNYEDDKPNKRHICCRCNCLWVG